MSKKIKHTYLIITAIIILGFAGIIIHRSYLSDSRETRISKLHEKYFYLNLDDDVEYVGNENCVSCHLQIHETFHKTGMGRSLYNLTSENEIEDFTNENIIYDHKSDYYYQVYREGKDYFQKEFRIDKTGNIIHELVKKIDYVIGSGNNTRSYLFHENGFFFEMPVSWFTEKAKWDLSPGYQRLNLRFSRPIVQECMNCHNDYSGYVEFSENKFDLPLPEGISCERCHGPGELHVLRHSQETDLFRKIEDDTFDRTIVNPIHLPLEENLSVCFQCHLQGDVRVFTDGKKQNDFKPGMKLSDVKTIFVQDDIKKGDFKIASHAARMYLSDCFIKSDGAMTCITCHNPHIPVQEVSKKFFNDKCIDCHSVQTLSPTVLPKTDHREISDCITCHMRQGATADVLHVNFTDHWIRKEIEVLSEKENEDLYEKDALDKRHTIAIVLKNFNNPDDEFADMNLGIAYVMYYETKHPHFEYLKRAIPLLEENLKKFPEHKNGLYHLGIAYLRENKITDAINTLTKLIEIDPENASAYSMLGRSYEKASSPLKAIESYNSSLNIFPENVSVLHNLGDLLYSGEMINEAIEVYKKAITIISNKPAILNNLGDLYLYKMQNIDAAIELFEQALGFDPDMMQALNNLGNAFMLQGKTLEAEAIFKKVIEKDPKNVLAYGNLAVLFEDREDITAAKRMLNKVLEIDPNDVRAKQMLEKLE
jgi:Tfp pilus assembly protein PilF